MAIVTAFGQNSDGAAWTINFLLAKILSNLTQFNSEPGVVSDTIRLLVSVVDTKDKGRQVRGERKRRGNGSVFKVMWSQVEIKPLYRLSFHVNLLYEYQRVRAL